MTRIIRTRDITHHVGISRSKVYELVAQGKFPKPVMLSAARVGFVEREVQAWIEERIRERDEGVSSGITPVHRRRRNAGR